MKCKVTTGAGLRGLVKYQTAKAGSSFIGGSQPSPNDFLREVAALRNLRPDCKKPALHISLSLPDGESLSNADWARVAERFREKMNLGPHSFFAVRHADTAHDHIHIAVNMISADGKRWDSNKSALRAQAACSEIEAEFGLSQTRTLDEFQREEGHRRRVVRDAETNEFRRTGQVKSVVERAIAARKKEEKNHESNRKTHRAAIQRDAGLAVRAAADQGADSLTRKTDQTDRSAGSLAAQGFEANRKIGGAADRVAQPFLNHPNPKEKIMLKNIPIPDDSCGAIEASPLLKSLPPSAPAVDPNAPPTLAGRLMPVRQANNSFDLFWKDHAEKPSFRWQPDDQRLLILASPNEKNVSALFDAAAEKGIGMPQIQITGSPEFQRIAAVEAAKRGLPVDCSRLDPSAAELYRSTFSQQHGEAANALTASAYESQRVHDEQQRAAEAARAKESDAARKDASRDCDQQKMRA